MITETQLTAFLDELFAPISCDDASNNGLQFQGAAEISGCAFAVDACKESFEAAAAAGCNYIFCHHGLSWGGGIKRMVGVVGGRVNALAAHGLSLYAMHLRLDAHPQVGNNAQLAQVLGLAERKPFSFYHGITIGWSGPLSQPCTLQELSHRLGGNPRCYDFRGGEKIHTVAIVSGGGDFCIEEAAAAGAQCMVTGEFTHQNYHIAKELGIDVLAGGHYYTETFGPKAVMQAVQQRFPDLKCYFVDAETGL